MIKKTTLVNKLNSYKKKWSIQKKMFIKKRKVTKFNSQITQC